ncbi:MAG: redoxin domain-containing protein [Candidatus Eremiobacteraeota bacterium]|mgnify:CR=1 FL=1|nr:redoxin domain-containing protein [Candidatus Eremiobacteraeota bacterium]
MRKMLFLAGLVLVAAAAWAQAFTSTPLKVGETAPAFELQGSDGKTYSLKQFAGQEAVVLAWFPKAQTKGCTIECKSLGEQAEALRKYKVALFAISVDKPEDNKTFAENLKLPYPILSDPSRETAKAYGVLKGAPVSARNTIYIGKDGKVLLVDDSIKTETAAADMLKHFEQLGIEKK